MLVTQLKPKEELLPIIQGERVLTLQCYGCAGVFFPKEEINLFLEEVTASSGRAIVKNIITDYLCNHEYTRARIGLWSEDFKKAEKIIVFSCGVGVQVVSLLLGKHVYPGCDTIYLNGFQGLTTLNFDCAQCGECFLNYTGGICPLTACAKSLLNGPCGGAKNGKCEVASPTGTLMDCGWEKIYKKLEAIGRLDILKEVIRLRDYKKLETGIK